MINWVAVGSGADFASGDFLPVYPVKFPQSVFHIMLSALLVVAGGGRILRLAMAFNLHFKNV